MDFHIKNEALVTLAVRKRDTFKIFLFNSNNLLCGWENKKMNIIKIVSKNNDELTPLAFSGIHIINPSLFLLMTEEGYFSIIDVYLRLAKKHRIIGYNHDNSFWLDLGKKENLLEAEKLNNKIFLNT